MVAPHAYLQQMIDRSGAALLGRDARVTEGLLFLGNPQLVFPRLLFEDPILEPVDRNVWAAIKLHASDGDAITAFPSYEELMLRCNIGSKATVARSISILRACRWLTVCKSRLRDAKGRVKGNIYALHDEPLQLVETLGLDDHYLTWLAATAEGKHTPHPRAIALANQILQDMQDQVQAGEDITQLRPPMERRTEAMLAISGLRSGKVAGRFFTLGTARSALFTASGAVPKSQVQELYLVTGGCQNPSTENVLGELVGGEYRNCTGVSTVSVLRSNSSSKYINKTTTTSVGSSEVGVSTETVPVVLAVDAWPPAVRGLAANDRELVRLQLGTVPAALQLPVLSALSAKLESIAVGGKPLIYGIFPYTRTLCQKALRGELNPVTPVITHPSPANQQPNRSVESETAGITLVDLTNLSNEVKTLQGLQKAQPKGSDAWDSFTAQIEAKKAEWYRVRDMLQAQTGREQQPATAMTMN